MSTKPTQKVYGLRLTPADRAMLKRLRKTLDLHADCAVVRRLIREEAARRYGPAPTPEPVPNPVEALS